LSNHLFRIAQVFFARFSQLSSKTVNGYQQASFVNWDFDTVWMICEGRDYPRLQWEGIACEPNDP